MISFIRDPLSIKISLINYLIQNEQKKMDINLENFLLSNNNLIAKHLGATEKNYEKIIRGYFFIGVIECFDESISKLEKITQINFTIDNKKKNISKKYFLKSDLSDEIISRFMIKNVLDYKIYNLAKHLLKE